MIGHSVERATGDEAMEAVYGHAHLSHKVGEVAADTSYTNPSRITFIMPPDDDINPPPLVNSSTTTI